MAQRKSDEKTTLAQVLKMADQLTPEEQEQLVDQMKIQWLRRALDEAEKSAAEGRVLTEEQLLERLDKKRKEIEERQGK